MFIVNAVQFALNYVLQIFHKHHVMPIVHLVKLKGDIFTCFVEKSCKQLLTEGCCVFCALENKLHSSLLI